MHGAIVLMEQAVMTIMLVLSMINAKVGSALERAADNARVATGRGLTSFPRNVFEML